MYKHICEFCNKEFENSHKNSRFCSKSCVAKSLSKKIECTCDNCGKIIYKKKDEYEKNKNHFCSQKCHYEFKSMGTEEIECLNCGNKKIVFKKDHRQFCSHQCYMQYHSKDIKEKIQSDESRKRICKCCGKEFIVFPSETNKFLCSIECKMKWLKENVYSKEDYMSDKIKQGKQSFYSKYEQLDTNVELLSEYINAKTKINCRCKIHRDSYFKMLPSHITQGQTGCVSCYSKSSINEKIIADFLTQYEYKFERQKTFDGCKYESLLPFDFYLTDYNIAIEYDGEGHDKVIPRGNMTYEEAENELKLIIIRDNIKTEYCKQNNIPLIRISYKDKEQILYILWDELVKYKAIIENN